MKKIGIYCEGSVDKDSATIFSERLLTELGEKFVIPENQVKVANGPIIPTITSMAKIYLDLPDCVDLVIFFADQDGKDNNQRVLGYNKIKLISEYHFQRSVVAVANPHFEKWLISDMNTFKPILGIKGSLKNTNLVNYEYPKFCLEHYHSTWDIEDKPSLIDLKIELAKSSDLARIANACPDFLAFRDDLTRKIKF